MKKSHNRRQFFRQGLTAVGLSLSPAWLSAAPVRQKRPHEKEETIILFQGDSITDAGRNRKVVGPNHPQGLGGGYAGLISAELTGKAPGSGWKCYNRGISGHKVFQLAERWESDCLDLKPDVLSILIGVNDFWHTLSHDYPGTVEDYENDFRALLARTRKVLPAVKLIIAEPFAVAGGTALNEAWSAFPAYQAVAAQIASDFRAQFIPYQRIFDKALKKAPAAYWCPDGVHPSPAGNYLMAQAWLSALKKVY